jgi:hypothetical protein
VSCGGRERGLARPGKYAADCKRLFGELLHHESCFGIDGEETWVNHARATVRMRWLWLEVFGEPQCCDGERCCSTDRR